LDKINTGANHRLAKVVVHCSADAFVINKNSVLHINNGVKIATLAAIKKKFKQ